MNANTGLKKIVAVILTIDELQSIIESLEFDDTLAGIADKECAPRHIALLEKLRDTLAKAKE